MGSSSDSDSSRDGKYGHYKPHKSHKKDKKDKKKGKTPKIPGSDHGGFSGHSAGGIGTGITHGVSSFLGGGSHDSRDAQTTSPPMPSAPQMPAGSQHPGYGASSAPYGFGAGEYYAGTGPPGGFPSPGGHGHTETRFAPPEGPPPGVPSPFSDSSHGGSSTFSSPPFAPTHQTDSPFSSFPSATPHSPHNPFPPGPPSHHDGREFPTPGHAPVGGHSALPAPSPGQHAQAPPSGFRVPLTTGQAFPQSSQAGPPAAYDADGSSPVFFGSAIMEGSVHPCKIAPHLDPPCRVPYGGTEYSHVGRYDLLPFDERTMVLVTTDNGRIPSGKKPVEGGYEDHGGKLYHAVATIQGIRVPGKTGEHLGGCNVAFGGGEHSVSQGYQILCWK
ncbi:hypothetical protein NLI96_g6647 [Meripilus lineatus]|uniref:Uncharacterized protein n=1 Tax=Meripilus lineatus TaxID=2056292 RepID=A0AAD5V0V8_9APHY|nr:hypothetical protein NLI96_g6647 [Physisporinus lineatus]